jgi:hypothetical protein
MRSSKSKVWHTFPLAYLTILGKPHAEAHAPHLRHLGRHGGVMDKGERSGASRPGRPPIGARQSPSTLARGSPSSEGLPWSDHPVGEPEPPLNAGSKGYQWSKEGSASLRCGEDCPREGDPGAQAPLGQIVRGMNEGPQVNAKSKVLNGQRREGRVNLRCREDSPGGRPLESEW